MLYISPNRKYWRFCTMRWLAGRGLFNYIFVCFKICIIFFCNAIRFSRFSMRVIVLHKQQFPWLNFQIRSEVHDALYYTPVYAARTLNFKILIINKYDTCKAIGMPLPKPQTHCRDRRGQISAINQFKILLCTK
jgi:hypothetical protein